MTAGFIERLQNDVVIMYMPMQTFLVHEYGKPMEAHLSEWVVNHPKEYQDAARRSFEAGCDMVHTATQACSPFRAKPFGITDSDRIYELNYRSAQMAKEVTPEGCYVVGNISSTNPDFLEPVGTMTYDQVYDGYKVQISGLRDGGVDMFHIAGNHLEEELIAIKVAKDHSRLPILGLADYYAGKKGFKDWAGIGPREGSEKLQNAGSHVMGAICGLMTKSTDPSEWYPAATQLVNEVRKGCDKPIAIQPDAGLAQLIGTKTIYPATPELMAREVLDWITAGARLVGGCCGTSLDHYRAISSVIKSWRGMNI
jgi:5-methyltetrahydrofolate--homocysteine methyltransferase